MADIGVVLRQQQTKLGDQLAKKTHFHPSQVEVAKKPLKHLTFQITFQKLIEISSLDNFLLLLI